VVAAGLPTSDGAPMLPPRATLLALTGLLAATTAATAQRPAPADARRAALAITADGMRGEIARLADDSTRGRLTPSPELDEVAAYIAGEFRRLGLRPAGDSGGYLQRYPIRCTAPDTGSFVELAAAGTSAHWALGRDVITFQGQVPAGDASGPVVLLAGVPTDTADLFGGIDLRHATILAVLPVQALGRGDAILPHMVRALQRGASTWIVVSDMPGRTFAAVAGRSAQPSCGTGAGSALGDLAILGVRDSTALGPLRAAGVDVAALLATPTAVARALTGATIRLHGTSRFSSETSAPNVVGILPGSDPALRDEYLVVTAHMDHLGVRAPVDGDSIYNGADDNASGTAAVLEIARAFGRLGAAPRRSIVFLAVSGEEEGLWGSGWYVGHPAAPLDRTVADLDMDMISRGWRDSVSVIGLDFSTLGETIRRVAREHAALVAQPVIDHWPQQNFLVRSDHINFARRGVPILYFLDGTPAEYHKVNDETATIDAEAAARIARLAFLTALDVANAAERPTWDPASRQRLVTGGN
jgi:hypothetical protein